MNRVAPSRRAFTLLEATIAIALTAMAGSAILLGLSTVVSSTTESLQHTIADGMAQQLADEIIGTRYAEIGSDPYEVPFTRTAWEGNGTGRERFNDCDDFHGVNIQPPTDPWGVPIGTEDISGSSRHANFQIPAGYFSQWRQKVNVYYVSPTNLETPLSTGGTSDFRCVDVTIEWNDPIRGWLPLGYARRVVTYLQQP